MTVPTEALSSAHVLTICLDADRTVHHAYNNRRHMCAADAGAGFVGPQAAGNSSARMYEAAGDQHCQNAKLGHAPALAHGT